MWNAGKIKQLCKEYNVHPEKARGQHFLIDDSVVRKMVEAAGIGSGDTVVEVGPGWGILTEELLKKAKKVIAIEIEKKFVQYLRGVPPPLRGGGQGEGDQNKTPLPNPPPQGGREQLEIHHSDILRSWNKMPREPYSVIANLPYHITSRIIRGFLEKTTQPPQQMVIMVQKEVADRIIAKPGDMSMLALSVQWYSAEFPPPLRGGGQGEGALRQAQGLNKTPLPNPPPQGGRGQLGVKKLFKVSKGAFWPQPEVDSAVIHIQNIIRPSPEETCKVFALANRAFKTKRKMLSTSLAGTQLGATKEEVAKTLSAYAISAKARPQELSVENWRCLAAA